MDTEMVDLEAETVAERYERENDETATVAERYGLYKRGSGDLFNFTVEN